MTTGGLTRLVRVAACGLVLLPAGWATSQALAEGVPVPTVPLPTTVAPDPAPEPPVSVPQPDPAPAPAAPAKPARTPVPRPSSQPRVSTPTRVAPRPAARATRVTPVATPKPKPKAKPKPKPKAKAKPAATVTEIERPAPLPSRPVVKVEPVRSDDGLFPNDSLIASGIAFFGALLVPIWLVTALVIVRRRRPARATVERPSSRRVPDVELVRSESIQLSKEAPPVTEPEAKASAEQPVSRQVFTPPASPTPTPAPAIPDLERVRSESIELSEEVPTVTEPEVKAPVERAEWEYCEIDWWRGYVKSQFIAKASTPDDGDFIVHESPMFRWRGNGIPEATPASVAALEQLIERLRAEGWEGNSGTSATWYAQTLRRRLTPTA
jgi:hypothetical protein